MKSGTGLCSDWSDRRGVQECTESAKNAAISSNTGHLTADTARASERVSKTRPKSRSVKVTVEDSLSAALDTSRLFGAVYGRGRHHTQLAFMTRPRHEECATRIMSAIEATWKRRNTSDIELISRRLVTVVE